MKKIIFVFLFAVSTLIAQTYSGGSGTISDPYQIANKNDLKYLSEHSSDWSKSFIQTADINFSSTDFQSGGAFYNGGAGFIPIGNYSTKFTGNYNGNGHSIDGIFINRDGTHYVGLFGYIGNPYSLGNNSIIQFLRVTNVDITGEDNTAGVVGYSTKSTVLSCFSSGSVSGHYQVGGVIGNNDYAIIYESSSTCTINGAKYIGGVAGKNKNNTAKITKCYSTGDVNGEQNIGGLVGSNESGAVINNCYSTGSVTRTSGTNGYIGAFCGYNSSTIEYCYSLGSVFESPGVVWDEGSTGKDKGFIGYINGGVYNYNFWNKDISNQDGVLEITSGDSVASSITTVKMRYHSFFTDSNWDFIVEVANGTNDIWDMDQEKTINNGFPILSWQTGADQILAYSGGDGSSAFPYQIGNLSDLSDLTQRSLDWASNFIQTANIDAAPTQYWDDTDDDSDGDLFNDANDLNSMGNNEGFLPIANDIARFTGSYNGKSCSIDGLTFNRTQYSYAGLFGYSSGSGAEIKAINLKNINIYAYNYVGGIVGYNNDSAHVSYCSVSGNIQGYGVVGGLAGKNDNSSTVLHCASFTNIVLHGWNSAGGIVGFNSNSSTVTQCYSSKDITSTRIKSYYLGGIVGYSTNSSIVSESHSVCNVTGDKYVGGLVGYSTNSSIVSESYSIYNVVTGDEYIGGLVGYSTNSSLVSGSYSICNVTGNKYVGGLVGNNLGGSTISNCYSTGSVTDADPIDNNTPDPFGAFCGANNSVIEYCYSTGSVVSSSSYHSGFVGTDASGTYTANFWDSEVSNESNGIGATAKTTAEMQDANTFINSGWDFILETTNGTNDIWDIDQKKTVNNGYPILSWQYGSDQILFYSGGAGTSSDPYKIANKADLKYLEEHDNDWDANFIQTIRITFTPSDFQTGGDFYNNGSGFIPIGNYTTKFTGSYNGNNTYISGIIINRSSEDNIGFFGYTEGAAIQDLIIHNINITGNNYVGGLIGNTNSTTTSNCNVCGTLTANSYCGGLIGNNTTNSQVSNSYSTSTVSGNSCVGGLVGWNYTSTISGCYSYGNISAAGDIAGGLVGINHNSSSILDSYSYCTVNGKGSVGGLLGHNEASSVQTSYSSGTVSGTYAVGNFAGFNSNSSVISNSYSTGSVTRISGINTYFGAFCGENENSTIEYCYSSANVYSSYGTAWNEGGNADKGFVGGNSATVTYTANFFDSEASNQSSGTGAVAKTTSEMRDAQTFLNAGWDFISETANGNNDYWDMDQSGDINNGYPIFVWQSFSDPNVPRNLTLTYLTSTSASISWSEPINTNGGISFYYVCIQDQSNCTWTCQYVSRLYYIEANLSPNTTYYLKVAAYSTDFLPFTDIIQFTTLKVAPSITSFVANDPDNSDDYYSNGDALTINFDMATNGSGILNKSGVDALFTFSSPLGIDYSGEWINASKFTITVSDITGGSPTIDLTTARVRASAGLRNIDETSDVSIATSPALSGDWGSNPLPVELSSFVATYQKSGVMLNWTTATEVNNYGFEILRSTLDSEEWEKIGFVEGHGNSNSPNDYSFIDNNPVVGEVNYRLKQIDTDGKFKYSDIIVVKVETPKEFKLVQNYPNPFNPSTTISFELPKQSKVRLSVYNALGEEVVELLNKNISAGKHQVNFDGSNLSSGLYFYKISTNNFVDVKKMMLLK